MVQGKLTFNPWVDREGTAQVSADLLLQDFQFVGGTNEKDEHSESANENTEYSVETEISGDVQEIANQTHSY